MASYEENERVMYNYGVILMNGEGIEKIIKKGLSILKSRPIKEIKRQCINKEEGIKYLKLAVSKGDVNSIAMYGQMLLCCDNVEMNKDEGIRLLKLAADERKYFRNNSLCKCFT